MAKYTISGKIENKNINENNEKQNENVLDCDNQSVLSLEKVSSFISNTLDRLFYIIGYKTAKHPLKVIISVVFITFCCTIGFIEMRNELDPIKLWVPEESDFIANYKTVLSTIKDGFSPEILIMTSKTNVLTPKNMRRLYVIDEAIRNIVIKRENGSSITYNDVCFKWPLLSELNIPSRKRKRSLSKMKIDNDLDFETRFYCAIMNGLEHVCKRDIFIEMWNSNRTAIKRLTESEILDKVNEFPYDPETGHFINYRWMLGGVEKDESGRIISAKSLITAWNLKVNFINENKIDKVQWQSEDQLDIESIMDGIIEHYKEKYDDNDTLLSYGLGRSYGDTSSKSMFEDISKVVLGVTITIIYVIFVTSKCGWVELRCSLAIVGIINVGLAYFSGCGIASLLLYPFSPLHASLFFILLGLGVDDIFVILACLRKVKDENKNITIEDTIGKAMAKAGTAITITTITDIIAFLVGGTTVLPSLKSFCVFAAFCVFINYAFVVTFFVACLVLDEGRIKANRNGVIPFIKHEKNDIWCEPKLMQKFIRFFYSNIVLTIFGKILILTSVLVIAALSGERVLRLQNKFDIFWFIPNDSQYFQFIHDITEYYPTANGYRAAVYFKDVNHIENLSKMYELSMNLKNKTQYFSTDKSWIESFHNFMTENHPNDYHNYQDLSTLNETFFNQELSTFLFSIPGAQYNLNFKFNESLECGRPVKKILLSWINIHFNDYRQNSSAHIPAKQAVLDIIESSNFNVSKDQVFLWGPYLGNWITNETVEKEIYPNILAILIGVFICTLVMIVNLQVCFLILVTVLLSLVTIGGLMEYSGLTIDIVTCFALQLSVGLCIDFATHIGHTFLTISKGNGTERALKTAESIVDAVWQGGLSTLIAVSLLSFSEAYVFRILYRVISFVVITGIFYGTLFLPVVLSIFNPRPYIFEKEEISDKKSIETFKETQKY